MKEWEKCTPWWGGALSETRGSDGRSESKRKGDREKRESRQGRHGNKSQRGQKRETEKGAMKEVQQRMNFWGENTEGGNVREGTVAEREQGREEL